VRTYRAVDRGFAWLERDHPSGQAPLWRRTDLSHSPRRPLVRPDPGGEVPSEGDRRPYCRCRVGTLIEGSEPIDTMNRRSDVTVVARERTLVPDLSRGRSRSRRSSTRGRSSARTPSGSRTPSRMATASRSGTPPRSPTPFRSRAAEWPGPGCGPVAHRVTIRPQPRGTAAPPGRE
jgi:hypothetical protein